MIFENTYDGRDYRWAELQARRESDATTQTRVYVIATVDGLIWDTIAVDGAAKSQVLPTSVPGRYSDPANPASTVIAYVPQSLDITEVGDGVYELEIVYSVPEEATPATAPNAKVPEVGTSAFEFQTSLENVTFLKSKKPPVRRLQHKHYDTGGAVLGNAEAQAAQAEAVAVKSRININQDGEAEGAEVLTPTGSFSIRYSAPSGFIDTAYRIAVEDLVGKINQDPYLGYAPQTLLFVGVSGSERVDGSWELLYNFRYRPGVPSFVIGDGDVATPDPDDIVIPAHSGWDYLWLKTVPREDPVTRKIEREPTHAFIHEIYERANFSMETTPDPGPLPPLGVVP